MTTQWTDETTSNTTIRNTSRFILLNDTPGDSVVTLVPFFRTGDSVGRGIAFYFTIDDPVILSTTSSGV